MNKQLSEMTNPELHKYLSEHRNNEEAFSQALELLIRRRENEGGFKMRHGMPPEEAEAILKAAIAKASDQS